MSQAVVNFLELVQIDQEKGERQSLSLSAKDFGLHARFGEPAVVETGEGIEHRQAIERVRARLFFLDFVTEILDPELLPQRVDVEEQNKAHEPADRQVQVELGEIVVA